MNITPILKVDKEVAMLKKDGSCVASGWVEIENAIRFPVRVMKWLNPETNSEQMFVSYPNKKVDGGWENILYPKEPEVRKEIQDVVLKEVRAQLFRSEGLDLPEVSNVRVSLLKEKVTGSISIKAMASINICGIEINGITVKEGRKGPFVQMPQRREQNGEYRDVVYGTNAAMQEKIKEAVLAEYTQVLSETWPEPQPEPEIQPTPEPHSASESIPESLPVSEQQSIPEPSTTQEMQSVPETQQISEQQSASETPPVSDEEKITVTNARYENGYLHFTTRIDGQDLASLFRIYDPKNGPDMTLVDIEAAADHPRIKEAWFGIEAGLQEQMQVRYEKIKNQSLAAKQQMKPAESPKIKM